MAHSWLATDTLPAGLAIAAVPNVGGTCTGGTVTATAGSGTITVGSRSRSRRRIVGSSCGDPATNATMPNFAPAMGSACATGAATPPAGFDASATFVGAVRPGAAGASRRARATGRSRGGQPCR